MRYLIPMALIFAGACAPRPASVPTPAETVTPEPVVASRLERSALSGMSASELVEHFGQPRLQVREGDGTKVQFVGPRCILDAYLYPPTSGQGVPRVTHVDARNAQGGDVNTQSCIDSLDQR